MTVKLGVYVVDVKVKAWFDKRTNKRYTEGFLNELSLVYDYAARYCAEQGLPSLAEDYKEKGDKLYDELLKAGAYNC